MRERVAGLVGGVSRAMWVMTFHSACARILRADARAARLQARVHDLRRGRLAAHGQAMHGRARARSEALPPRAIRAEISERQEPAHRLEPTTATAAGSGLRGGGRRRLRALRAPHGRGERDGLRRPARAHRQPARAVRRRAREVPPDVPLGPRRRVPGHQPRPVSAAAAARRGAPQSDGGRRRLSGGLLVPRRRHPQHPRVRARLLRRDHGPAGAELPLDADDPRRRERADRPQREPEGQAPVDRRRDGASRSSSPSSTTSTPRPATSPRRSTGWSRRGRRATGSRSSTGSTPRAGCSRTRWCGSRSPTR